MSSSAPKQAVGSPEKKRRNPIERAIVWGVIAVLLCVLALEYTSRQAYNSSLAQLQKGVQESDTKGNDFTAAQADQAVGGWHTKKVEDMPGAKVVYYHWPSLVKSYDIRMLVGAEDVVLRVHSGLTDPAPEEEPSQASAAAEKDSPGEAAAGAATSAEPSPHGAQPGQSRGRRGDGERGSREGRQAATDESPATEDQPDANTSESPPQPEKSKPSDEASSPE